MICDSCGSERIMEVVGYVLDRSEYKGLSMENPTESEMELNRFYLEADICLDCGKAQGKFPVEVEEEEEE